MCEIYKKKIATRKNLFQRIFTEEKEIHENLYSKLNKNNTRKF